MSTNKNGQASSDLGSLNLTNSQRVDVGALFQKLAKTKPSSDIKCDFKSNMKLILLPSSLKSPLNSTSSNFRSSFLPQSPSSMTSKHQSCSSTTTKGFYFDQRYVGGIRSIKKFDNTFNSIFQPNTRLTSLSSVRDSSSIYELSEIKSPKETKLLDIKGLFKPQKPRRKQRENNNYINIKELNFPTLSPQTVLINHKTSTKANFFQSQNHKQSRSQIPNNMHESIRAIGHTKLPRVYHLPVNVYQ